LKNYSHLIHLHIIVFIFGFTAILGKLISIRALELVWYRMLIAACVLFVLLLIKKNTYKIPLKKTIVYLGVGFIVAAHWLTFFHAIKVSNVSVTLACLAATTLFTSILEPIIIKRRFYWVEAVLGVFIILGLYLIFEFETRYKWGIFFALISALLAGLFNIINKKLTPQNNANVMSFYEMLGGFVIITIYIFLFEDIKPENFKLTGLDFMYLLLLGSVCTAYAFTAIIELMKKISAYVVILSINLEPVYGVIMAFFIFGASEQMTTGFYLGALIIVACVFLYEPLMRKFHRKKNIPNPKSKSA